MRGDTRRGGASHGLPWGGGAAGGLIRAASRHSSRGVCSVRLRAEALGEAQRQQQQQQLESSEPLEGSEHGQRPRQPGCKCREPSRLAGPRLLAARRRCSARAATPAPRRSRTCARCLQTKVPSAGTAGAGRRGLTRGAQGAGNGGRGAGHCLLPSSPRKGGGPWGVNERGSALSSCRCCSASDLATAATAAEPLLLCSGFAACPSAEMTLLWAETLR